MKKMANIVLALFAALSVFMFVSCSSGSGVFTAEQLSKKDWKEFKGTWEIVMKSTFAGEENEPETDEITIENEDDFKEFIDGLKSFDEEVSQTEVEDEELGKVTISGDTKGFNYSKGKLSRKIKITMALLGEEMSVDMELIATRK